jgi:glutathione S-transferase
MNETYTLYGAYASYYTAKVRSYLRKKAIPFVERLPSDPMFRSQVRPASGSHRIPQLQTPTGEVLQDSITIVDFLETRFPQLPAIPTTPNQRVFVHLMELLASEGLLSLAWRHRWLFEENEPFITLDFGRSFRPQGSDADLLKYGALISGRMTGDGLPPSTEEVRAALDDEYRALLMLLEAHFLRHPYFLGGQPTQADYSIMGALHAHLGRDPAGLRMMQNHAPRTVRWVEQMLLPEIQSPEFYSTDICLAPDDLIPETALNLLRHLADAYAENFLLGARGWNQAVAKLGVAAMAERLSENDQPVLDRFSVQVDDAVFEHPVQVYAEWLAQRSRRFFQDLPDDDQASVCGLLAHPILVNLLTTPVTYPLVRRSQRFQVEG